MALESYYLEGFYGLWAYDFPAEFFILQKKKKKKHQEKNISCVDFNDQNNVSELILRELQLIFLEIKRIIFFWKSYLFVGKLHIVIKCQQTFSEGEKKDKQKRNIQFSNEGLSFSNRDKMIILLIIIFGKKAPAARIQTFQNVCSCVFLR